jgi:hypothetical protein
LEPLTLQTPSSDHLQFDQLCAEVDEFEPLPTISSSPLAFEEDVQERTELDDQILAALVSPVY